MTREFVARLVQKDPEAWAAFAAEWGPRLWGFFWRKVRKASECDDLVQQTFTRAYQGIERFGGEGAFNGWVWRIAYNVWVDYLRKNAPEIEPGRRAIFVPVGDPETPEIEDQERDPESAAELRQEAPRIREALVAARDPVFPELSAEQEVAFDLWVECDKDLALKQKARIIARAMGIRTQGVMRVRVWVAEFEARRAEFEGAFAEELCSRGIDIGDYT